MALEPERALEAAVLALELATAAVILVSAAWALAQWAARRFHGTGDVRRRFGRSLLLALDLAIGADVVKVALVPTLEAAATIGITVLVRVVLTFVLEWELRRDQAGA